MRQIRLAAVAATIILSGVMFGSRTDAMTLAAPTALGVATAHQTAVQQVAVVCGNNGCAPVQTSAKRRPLKHP